jgi:uncharacterized membrane protein YphA (DoxX/SURF4 family)
MNINKILQQRWLAVVALIVRLVIGCIFLITGYSKVRPLEGMTWSIASLKISVSWFALSGEAYQILPHWAITVVAHVLPFAELTLGLWLILGLALKTPALASTLIVGTFFIAILSAYLRGLNIGCGCGLVPNEQVGPRALAIDGTLFMLCVLLTVRAFRPGPKPDGML